MKGDWVEVVVDTGQGTSTFEISASRAGRRIEITTARGIVEVTELTRGGTPVRTGRFMANRVVALVEHPAMEEGTARVEVETRRRLSPGAGRPGPGRGRATREAGQLALLGEAAGEAGAAADAGEEPRDGDAARTDATARATGDAPARDR
jgi:hypothetical protein